MTKRTIREFQKSDDIWKIIDTWAMENDYKIKSQSESTRLYQRGMGFLTAPMMIEITQKGSKKHLEAWISVNFIVRMFSLFIVPEEMGIESGGLRLILPRNIAREAVNKLLNKLGQSPIG
jgi:hypothetical protein